MHNKQTIKESGYTYLRYDPQNKLHILLNNTSKKEELFVANKNHASWGIIYKNTHLEFIGSNN